MKKFYTPCALVLLSTAAVANGDLVRMDGFLDVESHTIVEVEPYYFVESNYDETRFQRILTPGTEFNGIFAANHNTATEYHDQYARISNSSVLNTNANGYAFESTLNTSVDRGSGFQSFAENITNLDVMITFDVDTVVDIFLRIDYRDIGNSNLLASFVLQGLEGTPIRIIEVENPSVDGFIELAFQSTVLADQPFYLTALGWQNLIVNEENGGQLQSGDLVMTAAVSFVPGPGGIGLFAGVVVLATRRRR